MSKCANCVSIIFISNMYIFMFQIVHFQEISEGKCQIKNRLTAPHIHTMNETAFRTLVKVNPRVWVLTTVYRSFTNLTLSSM